MEPPRPAPDDGLPRAVVVANPISGRGRGARAAREIADGLARRGIATEVYLTRGRGDALAYLRARGPHLKLVCAVGGDGTVRECFEGLVDPEVPVAVMPFGTANVLARCLKLPREVHAAVELYARGTTAPIDVARVNGRLAFLITSVGIDAATVAEVERRRTGPITRWSYARALCASLRGYRPPRLAVEVDGERLEGAYGLVIVANTPLYGGVLHLDPLARLDDGRYEVYLFPTGRIGELARAFARGVVATLPGGAVRRVHARRVRVTADEPVPYQVDGDTGGATPLELEIAPVRYRLIVPADAPGARLDAP